MLLIKALMCFWILSLWMLCGAALLDALRLLPSAGWRQWRLAAGWPVTLPWLWWQCRRNLQGGASRGWAPRTPSDGRPSFPEHLPR